ncbi:MAG: cytochrome c family protein [Planctomycetota bacterium]
MAHPLRSLLALGALTLPLVCGKTPAPQDGGPAPLRLVLSGWMEGHLEPCGCASAQSGGLDRRGYWLLRNQHLYDLALEGGNLVGDWNALEDIELQTTLMVFGGFLERQGYRDQPLGPADLAAGLGVLGDYDQAFGPAFFATDLRAVDGDKREAPFPTFRKVEAAGYKLLLLDLVGGGEAPAGTAFEPPAAAVTAAMKQAGQRGKDWDLALCFAYEQGQDLRKLAAALPGIDVFVGCVRDHHMPGKPKPEVIEREGDPYGVARTTLLFPEARGRRLLLWQGLPDGHGSWKTVDAPQAIELPAYRNEARDEAGVPVRTNKDIWQALRDARRRVAEEGVLAKLAGRAEPDTGGRYVGNAACKDCHAAAYEVWKNSKHSHAWDSLVQRAKDDDLPVTKHPDCVGCHTIGYGDKTGFAGFAKTPDLVAVGCETCHGAGSKHVEAFRALPEGAAAEAVAEARKRGALRKLEASFCFRCHNFEQSPGFQFTDRWKVIEHR